MCHMLQLQTQTPFSEEVRMCAHGSPPYITCIPCMQKSVGLFTWYSTPLLARSNPSSLFSHKFLHIWACHSQRVHDPLGFLESLLMFSRFISAAPLCGTRFRLPVPSISLWTPGGWEPSFIIITNTRLFT